MEKSDHESQCHDWTTNMLNGYLVSLPSTTGGTDLETTLVGLPESDQSELLQFSVLEQNYFYEVSVQDQH